MFALSASLLLTACGNKNNNNTKEEIEDLGEFAIHTELQQQYLDDPDWESIKTYIPSVNAEDNKTHEDLSKPLPVTLEFDELSQSDAYYYEVAKSEDFANSKKFELTENKLEFYNSEIGQKYYVRAAVSEGELADAKVYSFSVKADAPRNIRVDGVINFRDSGGWESSLVAGARVKQGLYYRCAQFTSITAEGKNTLKELGIKLDIDMRDRPPAESPATSEDWAIDIMDAHVASGTEDYRWEGKNGSDTGIAQTYKRIFEAIAVADQKPIALHCTHGADRTGIVSWFLLGLLGVSKENCARDYVLTRFAGERAVLPNGSKSEIAKWNQKTEALEGATWAEKTYKHLNVDFGIEAETLETIREKFIPGYVKQANAGQQGGNQQSGGNESGNQQSGGNQSGTTPSNGSVNATVQTAADGNSATITWSAQDTAKVVSGTLDSNGKLKSKGDSVTYKFDSPIKMKARLYVEVNNRNDGVQFARGTDPVDHCHSVWYDYANNETGWKYDITFGTSEVNQDNQGTVKIGNEDVQLKEVTYSDGTAVGDHKLVPWIEITVEQGQNSIKFARKNGYLVNFYNFTLEGTKVA